MKKDFWGSKERKRDVKEIGKDREREAQKMIYMRWDVKILRTNATGNE